MLPASFDPHPDLPQCQAVLLPCERFMTLLCVGDNLALLLHNFLLSNVCEIIRGGTWHLVVLTLSAHQPGSSLGRHERLRSGNDSAGKRML